MYMCICIEIFSNVYIVLIYIYYYIDIILDTICYKQHLIIVSICTSPNVNYDPQSYH